MDWYEKVIDLCDKYRIELVRDGSKKILLRCPTLPSKEVQDKIRKWIPSNLQPDFIEEMKTKTYHLIAHYTGNFVLKNKVERVDFVGSKEKVLHFEVYAPGFNLEDAGDFIRNMNKLLISDGYFKGWVFKNNYDDGKSVFDFKLIKIKEKALSGTRPERDHVILEDEILNLRIALETMTCEEFIEKMWL